jgi:hypothetical protein
LKNGVDEAGLLRQRQWNMLETARHHGARAIVPVAACLGLEEYQAGFYSVRLIIQQALGKVL